MRLLLRLFKLALLFTAVGEVLQPGEFNLPSKGYIAAFGDFNADKHSDVFVVTVQNGTVTPHSVQVYLWDSKSGKFTPASVIKEDLLIVNVAPGDYNNDGHLDMLVSVQNNTVIDLHVYLGHITYFEPVQILTPSAMDNVLVMDFNNDLVPDLYGVAAGSGNRTVWLNNGQGSFTAQNHVVDAAVVKDFTSIASPHSNAFVDLDGDCLVDLFVTSFNPTTDQTRYEIWLNKAEGFVLHPPSLNMIVPRGAGPVSFSDVDGDGTMDMVFLVCWPRQDCSQENSIHVLYNSQKPMCPSIWDKDSPTCRAQDNLCSADPNFSFGDFSNFSQPTGNHVIVPTSVFTTIKARFGTTDDIPTASGLPRFPAALHVGDIDMDRHADLLVPLHQKDPVHANYISLWESEACTAATCSPAAVGAGRRTFLYRSAESGTASLQIEGSFVATFFDLSDDGTLDILVNVVAADGHVSSRALVNNYEEDAFFFTTLGSNGICPAWCPTSPKFPSPKPYGVNQAGMAVKFTVADLSGRKQLSMGCQLSQSAYLSLQTPYIFFGLGRTNNYIEWFYAGFPLLNARGGIGKQGHAKSWVTLIPNAQIFIFPFDWSLELFIPPSSRLLTVTIALLSTILLLALITCHLHRKEVREDRKEKDEQLLFKF